MNGGFWRNQAEQLAKALLRQEASSYAHHTLAKAAVQEVSDRLHRAEASDQATSQEALARSISKAEDVLRAGLQAYANDSHLLSEEARLRDILRQADRAVAALHKAFAGNEKSELIARRLARLLEAKDLIQPAIEVLQKALEFNPLNQRLHFYLAQLILRSRPDSTTKNAASMLHHLQRSFTAGDQNHEARFWYARQLCLTGSFQEAKPIFASLRALPLPFKQKHEPRDSFWARIALP